MLKATKLHKSVSSSSETHGITCPRRQFRDQHGCLCHGRDKVLTLTSLKCDLHSKDSSFVYITQGILLVHSSKTAKEAMISTYFMCLLSHNDKLGSALYQNEVNSCFSPRSLYLQFSEIITNGKDQFWFTKSKFIPFPSHSSHPNSHI